MAFFIGPKNKFGYGPDGRTRDREVERLVSEAKAALEMKRYYDAREKFNMARAMEPNNYGHYLELAITDLLIADLEGRPELRVEAKDLLNTGIDLDPHPEDLGHFQFYMKEAKKEPLDMAKRQKAAAGFAEHVLLGGSGVALLGEFQKREEDRIRPIEARLEAGEESVELLLERGKYRTDQIGRSLNFNERQDLRTKATEDLRTVLKKDPSNVEAKKTYLRIAENIDEVDRLAKEILEVEPNSHETYFVLAKRHKEKGDYEKAIEECKSAIERNPNEWTYYYLLIQAYENMGDYERATQAAINALERTKKEDNERAKSWSNGFESDIKKIQILRQYVEPGIKFKLVGNYEAAARLIESAKQYERFNFGPPTQYDTFVTSQLSEIQRLVTEATATAS